MEIGTMRSHTHDSSMLTVTCKPKHLINESSATTTPVVNNSKSNDSKNVKNVSSSVQPKNFDSKAHFQRTICDLIHYQMESCDHSKSSIVELNRDLSFPRSFDGKGAPYTLQPSLFPLVYPTVYFTTDDEELVIPPTELEPFLRWKLTTITANTMKAIVQRSGYRLMARDVPNANKKPFNNWNAIWTRHLKIAEFHQIGFSQRVNHFPGSFHLGRKDRLWMNLKAKSEKFGNEAFIDFHPNSFLLPREYEQLIEYWKKSDEAHDKVNGDDQFSRDGKKVFICKPPAAARGQGISIVSTIDELETVLASCNTKPTDGGHPLKKDKIKMVVQEYISNPLLLHNKAKFDLRVYALVTSVSPLRLYVFEDGLVRFASTKYSKSLESIQNQYIHLTNYSVNKMNSEYVPNKCADSQDGHKWTLKTLWKHMKNEGLGDPQHVWQGIQDLILKTVISSESHVNSLSKKHLKNKRSCFELLGFDIMLDENLKLWLLEVNITPSLRADSPLDYNVKNRLVKDVLNTLGYQLSPRVRRNFNFGQLITPERSDYLNKMRDPNDEKHTAFETLFMDKGFDACSNILDNLTDDDVVQLMEAEDELTRCGQLHRVFPSKRAQEYLRYFDFPYYYNLLLVSWEEKYQSDRLSGVNRLRNFMLGKEKIREHHETLKNEFESNARSLGISLSSKEKNIKNISV